MKISELENNLELQHVLIACYEYWRSEPVPPEQRAICYTWGIAPYREMFGTEFHQSKLYWLTKLGFLIQEETARGGGRRYYRIASPDFVKALVEKWQSPIS